MFNLVVERNLPLLFPNDSRPWFYSVLCIAAFVIKIE